MLNYMFRKLYEKINIYIYWVVPLLVSLVYLYLVSVGIFNLQATDNYNAYKFDFISNLLGTLLTVYGFMAILPENNFRRLLRKIGHDNILNRTVLIGVLSSLAFVTLFLIGFENTLHDILFLVAVTETVIATLKIFAILRFSAKSAK